MIFKINRRSWPLCVGIFCVISTSFAYATDATKPTLIMGVLSEGASLTKPLDAEGARAIAARFLKTRQSGQPGRDLQSMMGATPSATLAVGQGFLVRYAQTYEGRAVTSAEIALRIDTKGRVVRLVDTTLTADELSVIAKQSPLNPQEIVQRLRATLNASGLASPWIAEPELVIDGSLRKQIYRILVIDFNKHIEELYTVDAQSAEVIQHAPRIISLHQFKTYQPNPKSASPVVTPLAPESKLTPAMGQPAKLESEWLKGLSCIDTFRTDVISGIAYHRCEAKQLAVSDAQGDFTALTPLTGNQDGRCPTTRDANQNAFAEAHAYWHAGQTYTRFRKLYAQLGEADFKLKTSTGSTPQPLPIVVNYCEHGLNPEDPQDPLKPVSNAFFAPTGATPIGGLWQVLLGQKSDLIVMGMGSKTSMAMDGFVVSHEFTHAVIHSRNRLQQPFIPNDRDGNNSDAYSLNEAFADYFAATIQGVSEVGSYGFENISEEFHRNLVNDLNCSDQRTNMMHLDSQALSGALWESRLQICGQPKAPEAAAVRCRDRFDEAILATIDGLSQTPSMQQAAQIAVQEVRLRAAELGNGAGDVLQSAATRHGLWTQCDHIRRHIVNQRVLNFNSMRLPTWEVSQPAGTKTVQIILRRVTDFMGNTLPNENTDVQLQLVAHPGSEPLRWQDVQNGNQKLFATRVDFARQADQSFMARLPLPSGRSYFSIWSEGFSGNAVDIDISITASGPELQTPPVQEPLSPSETQEKNSAANGCHCQAASAGAHFFGREFGFQIVLMGAIIIAARRHLRRH